MKLRYANLGSLFNFCLVMQILLIFLFRLLPLENNSNTVIVVGGVHWIVKKHIDIILEVLKRYILYIFLDIST